jgi:hypothetical protein
MSVKKILIVGVGHSGADEVYSLVQQLLERERPEDTDYVYEPFLWQRKPFNKLYGEITNEFSLVSSVAVEGLFHNKKLPLFLTKSKRTISSFFSKRANDYDAVDSITTDFFKKIFTPVGGKKNLLCMTNRVNGRLDLIQSLVPDVKIIFVIRNPMDVVNCAIEKASLFDDDFYESDYERFVESLFKIESASALETFLIDTQEQREYLYWYFMNKAALSYYKMNPDRVFPIVYESFNSNKSEYVSNLCKFLELNKAVESSPVSKYSFVEKNNKSYLTRAGYDYINQSHSDYEELVRGLGLSINDTSISQLQDINLKKEAVDVPKKNSLYLKLDYRALNERKSKEIARLSKENKENISELAESYKQRIAKLNKENKENLFDSTKANIILENYVNTVENTVSKVVARPRILVLSATPIGSDSATGVLMEDIFEGSYEDIFQIFARPKIERNVVKSFNLLERHGQTELEEIIAAYGPDIIYFRPTEDPWYYCQKVFRFMLSTGIPYVCHIMDDWIVRLSEDEAEWLANKFEPVLKRASFTFTISEKMSDEYTRRYGIQCSEASNFFQFKADPSGRLVAQSKPIKLVYCGGLSDDMNYATIKNVVAAVKKMDSKDLIFDIHVPSWHQEKARKLELEGQVRVLDYVNKEDYFPLLCSADISLVAYNFDEASIAYCRYSMANKLPDVISSLRPLLIVGSKDIATISFSIENEIGKVVNIDGVDAIFVALKDIMSRYDHYSIRAALNYKNLDKVFSKENAILRFNTTLLTSTESNVHLIK